MLQISSRSRRRRYLRCTDDEGGWSRLCYSFDAESILFSILCKGWNCSEVWHLSLQSYPLWSVLLPPLYQLPLRLFNCQLSYGVTKEIRDTSNSFSDPRSVAPLLELWGCNLLFVRSAKQGVFASLWITSQVK